MSDETEEPQEETVKMQKVVVYDETHDFPINGVNQQFKMGDVLLFRERQARRYVENINPEILDARYVAEEDDVIASMLPQDAIDPIEVPKSEVEERVGKVGEVEKLKAQLRAMEGRAPPIK